VPRPRDIIVCEAFTPSGLGSVMTILNSYVLKTFLRTLAFVLPLFVVLYLAVEFVERIDDFIQDQGSIDVIMHYFLLRALIVAVQIAPFAILLSVTLTLALLERSREIIALLGAGASPWRIVQPLLLGSILLGGISLGVEEFFLPGAHRGIVVLQDTQKRAPPQGALIEHGEIWFRTPEKAFVHIELVDAAAERIHGITIYRKDNAGELSEQIEAQQAIWLGAQWSLLHGTISRFRDNLPMQIEPFTYLDIPIGIEPEALRSMFRPPAQMSLSELRSYMRKLRGRGVDMEAYARDFQLKLAVPIMGVVMAVVGFAAMWGTHAARPIGLGFVATLCGALVYWLLATAGTALSASQRIPLLLGIWLPHVVVLSCSAVIFWRKART
jgi:lipopolysaccharide export system permease protein